MTGLLDLASTDETPTELVRRSGDVLATFDHRTQDSGNVSWLVRTAAGEFFVKTAGKPGPPPPGAPIPGLDHDGRIQLLRNAVELAHSCDHHCLARLRHVVESPLGPVLVYDRAPGDLVGVPRERRADPDSAYQRFAHLPAQTLLGLLSDVIDVHRSLAASGWVAHDLYDGCLLVDFDTDRLTVIDLDSYHRGPTTNATGRRFGSSRFMAPEEDVRGAVIDERTTVYTLARLAWHFGTRLTEQRDEFCGSPGQAAVLTHALEADPGERFDSVAAFADAWAATR